MLLATVETENGKDSIYYVHTDHLTGSNVITDSSGKLAQALDYYPFGAVRVDQRTGAFNEQKKFTGKEIDKDTGLYYYGARYYDGRVGRFTGIDGAFLAVGDSRRLKQKTGIDLKTYLTNPQQLNSYSYSFNNPLIYRDETGEFAFLAPLAGYAVAYAPVWIPAVITTTAAITAAVVTWYNSSAIGYLTEGDLKSTENYINKTETTLTVGAAVITGTLVAGEMLGANYTNNKPQATNEPEIDSPYKRPSNATTPAQRASVQGKSCITCGKTEGKMVADHKIPLVKEYYESGTIDTQKMRSTTAVQPQCPTCSNKQGGQLSAYSKQQANNLNLCQSKKNP